MRAIAEYAMRGRSQAVIAAGIAAAIPLFFWISAAIVALVTLRRGLNEGLLVLLWAVLPAGFWLFVNDPTPIVVIVGTAILAAILRATVSWINTLMVGLILGILLGYVIPGLLPENVVTAAVEMLRGFMEKTAANMGVEAGTVTTERVALLLGGFLGSVHLVAALACLMLARWWQALLFNPGGFASEFRALLIPRLFAFPLVLFMLMGVSIHPLVEGWIPVLTIPFLFAAIGLAHGAVALKKASGNWLVAFYLMVFFLGPYFYVVLAALDSVMDFRQRISRRQSEQE